MISSNSNFLFYIGKGVLSIATFFGMVLELKFQINSLRFYISNIDDDD